MIIEQYFHPSYERGDDPVERFYINSMEDLKSLKFIQYWVNKENFVELGCIKREDLYGRKHSLVVAGIMDLEDDSIMYENVAYIITNSGIDLPLVGELVQVWGEALK